MVRFKQDIAFVPGGNITADILNTMAFNEFWIYQKKIQAQIRSVNPNGTTKKPRWVINNVGFFAKTFTVTPGGDLSFDSEGLPYFKKTLNFPNNYVFDNDYQPMAIISVKGNRSLPQSVILNHVANNHLDYTVYILEDENIAGKEFTVNVIVIGVHPLDNSAFEGDTELPE